MLLYRRSSLLYTASFQEEKDEFNIETDLAAVNLMINAAWGLKSVKHPVKGLVF